MPLRLRALWECNHHPSPHFSSPAFAKNNEVLFQQVIQCSVSATLSAVTCKVLHPYMRTVPQQIFPLVDVGCRDLRAVDHARNMKCYLKCLPCLLPLLCFPLWLCTKAHWYYNNCLVVFKNLPWATLVRWEKKNSPWASLGLNESGNSITLNHHPHLQQQHYNNTDDHNKYFHVKEYYKYLQNADILIHERKFWIF